MYHLSSRRRKTLARIQSPSVVRSKMEDAIEDWMALMLVLLDMDPMLYVDFCKWIEEEEDDP